MLKVVFSNGGFSAVSDYLRFLADSIVSVSSVNNWEAVLLNALSGDQEFCSLEHLSASLGK